MATTIARLAAVLTAETSQFNAGMQRSGAHIRRLESQASSSGAVLGKLSKSLGMFSGGFGGVGNLAFNVGGVAGPIGAAATAATALAIGLAKAGDAARDTRAAMMGLETNATMFAKLKSAFGTFAEGTGLTLKPLIQDAQDLVDWLNRVSGAADAARDRMQKEKHMVSWMDPKVFAELKASGAKGTEEKRDRWLQQFMEDFDRAGQQMEDWQQKFHQEWGANAAAQTQRLREGAEQIRDSVAMPLEKFEQTIQRIMELRDVSPDIITPEVFKRAIEKAKEDAEALLDKADKLQEIGLAGGFDRFTAAGFSQVQRGQAARTALQPVKADPAQLALDKAAVEALKSLNQKKPIEFKLVNFN